jgi:small subunit ribosomal protein S8e
MKQATEEKKISGHREQKLKVRNKDHKLARELDDQLASGRFYAAISSRPGQCGRCDGYILEGKELDFYLRKLQRKKSAAKQ